MLRHIEDGERITQTMVEANFACNSSEDIVPSVAKVSDLEFAIEQDDEDGSGMSVWRNRIIEMIEKIDIFERQYIVQSIKQIDNSP